MTDFKCILVPLDGSPLSERAVSGAMTIAQKFQSEVILLHVLHIPMPPPQVSHPEPYTGWMRSALTCAHRKAENYLDAQQQKVCRQGIEVRALMCNSSPTEGILDVAESEQVDLIVMNGHEADELARWNLGSIAGQVARQSPCPVLLMGHPA